MRKLLFILIALMGLGATYAQSQLAYWDAVHKQWVTVGSVNDTSKAFGPLPITNSEDWAHVIGGYEDTTSAAGDTVAPTGITTWWDIKIQSDDTIMVSSDPTYPAQNSIVILPTTSPNYEIYSFDSGKMNISYIPKIYYKLKGTGTPYVRLYWRGN